jgi:hypothetical protein
MIDLSEWSKYAVRPGFATYGCVAFFDSDTNPCGIWSCEQNRIVMETEGANYHHVSAVFKSTLQAKLTIKDHLIMTHWTIANGLLLASERWLSAKHPIRVLSKPHVYNTASINAMSATYLAPYMGIAGRNFAFTEEGWSQLVAEQRDSFVFESFEEHFAASGLPDSMKLSLPMYEDCIPYWNIVRTYVSQFIDIFYPTEVDIAHDSELHDYWNDFSTQINGRSYGLQTLNKHNLINQLTHSIFWVTVGHELMGNISMYLYSPYALVGKIRKGRDQSDIQTFFQGVALITLTTAALPMLMDDWSVLYNEHTVNNATPEKLKQVLNNLNSFQTSLQRLSEEIDSRNMFRIIPFESANPKYLESSVSV